MEKIKYITSLEAENLTRSVAKPLLLHSIIEIGNKCKNYYFILLSMKNISNTLFHFIHIKSITKKYKSNFSFLFIYDRKNTPLAIIKFSAMIPVPKEVNVVHLLKYEEKDKKYKNLISSGYRYINSNRQEIHVRELIRKLKSYYTDHSF